MAEISFGDLTFSNASTRYLGPYGDTINEVLGSFGANVQATVTGTFDGATRTGIQIEGSRTNHVNNSQGIENYTPYRLSYDDDTTATTDPLGGNTAEELIPNTDENTHYTEDTAPIDGTSAYAFSLFAKADGYDGVRLSIHEWCFVGDDPFGTYDLSPPSIIGSNSVLYVDIEDADNSWCLCFQVMQSDTSHAGIPFWFYVLEAGYPYFDGDGTSSIYAWQSQIEEGFWPSSIIPVPSTTDVTRAADNAYFAEGDVVSALRGKIDIYLIPQFSSAMLDDSGTTHTILDFDDSVQPIKIYIEETGTDSGHIVVYGASALLTTGALTWSRGQLLKITIDPANGEITTSGFTSGDNTYSDTPWSTSDGDVYLGQSSSNTEHFFGIIFQPEYTEAAGVNSAMLFSRNF